MKTFKKWLCESVGGSLPEDVMNQALEQIWKELRSSIISGFSGQVSIPEINIQNSSGNNVRVIMNIEIKKGNVREITTTGYAGIDEKNSGFITIPLVVTYPASLVPQKQVQQKGPPRPGQQVNSMVDTRQIDSLKNSTMSDMKFTIDHELGHATQKGVMGNHYLRTIDGAKNPVSSLGYNRLPMETDANLHAMIAAYKRLPDKQNVTLKQLLDIAFTQTGNPGVTRSYLSPKMYKMFLKRLNREGIPIYS